MQNVHLEAVPLLPERIDDYLHFFETILSLDSGEWGHCCYCISYCGMDNCNAQGFEQANVRRQGDTGQLLNRISGLCRRTSCRLAQCQSLT